MQLLDCTSVRETPSANIALWKFNKIFCVRRVRCLLMLLSGLFIVKQAVVSYLRLISGIGVVNSLICFVLY